MYVVHHNTLSDSFQVQIVWFQPKQDSDRIPFFKNRIGSDTVMESRDPLFGVLVSKVSSLVSVSKDFGFGLELFVLRL